MAEFEIITSAEGITPDWLTSVLRSSGSIDADTTVASVDATSMASEGGLLSELYRVAITYDGGTGPEGVVVKYPIDDEVQRMTADVLGFYPRELAFYDRIAPNAPFDVPAIHGAAIADDGSDFVLVMEDLADRRGLDQRAGVSIDDAKTVLSTMAAFHAAWWEHESIAELAATFLPIVNDVYLAALPGVFAGGWPGCQEHGGDLLTPDTIALGERFGDLVPWLLTEMEGPTTFVHGDWRADNCFIGSGDAVAGTRDSVTMIDFQISGFATGLYDVGYFLGQSVDSDERAGRDEELIRHYLAALAEHGVDYDFEEAWYKYRVVLVHCFIYGVTSFQSWEHWNDDQKEVLRTILGRSVRSIIDTEALSVLPE